MNHRWRIVYGLGLLGLIVLAWPWHSQPGLLRWLILGVITLAVLSNLAYTWRLERQLGQFTRAVARPDQRRTSQAIVQPFNRLSRESREQRARERASLLSARLCEHVAALRRSTGAHAAVLYLQNEEDRLALAAADASEPTTFLPVIRQPQEGEIIVMDYVFRHSKIGRLMEIEKPISNPPYYEKQENIRSFLAAPVVTQDGTTVGVLAIDSRKIQAFSESRDLDFSYEILLKNYADLLGQILDDDQQNSEIEERLQEWQAFFEAAKQLQSVNEQKQAVDCALSLVDSMFPNADLIAIVEAIPDEHSFVVRGLRGNVRNLSEGLTFAAIESWAGGALRQTTTPWSRDDDLGKRELGLPLIAKDDEIPLQGSVLCIPFGADDFDQAASGGLLLWSHRVREFSGADADTLAKLLAPFALAFARVRATELLKQQATRDALTGLFNRRVANETLDSEIRRASRGGVFSIVLFDIDHFKKVNDTYGHDAGDAVIKSVAKAILSCCRDIDKAARFGGEEFLLILPDTDTQGAQQMAERLRKTIKEQRLILASGKRLGVTSSFGVATYTPDAGLSAEGLLKLADEALYTAKQAGRDRVVTALIDATATEAA